MNESDFDNTPSADDPPGDQTVAPPPPPPAAPPEPPNGLAVAALVLGIIGTVFGLVPLTFWLAFILGVLALVFGLIARKKHHRRTMATWGASLGAVSLVLSVIGIVVLVTALDDTSEEVDHIFNCVAEEIETGTTSPDCD